MADVDTGTIAKAISKATNRTLYHLNVLSETGIVNCEIKPKSGRSTYHWSLKTKKLLLEIDMEVLAPNTLDTYLLRIILYYKSQNRPINQDFQQNVDIHELADLLSLDKPLVNIIIGKMDLDRILDTIYRKIYGDLLDYKKDRRRVKIDETNIQKDWNLSPKDALSIFYRLLQTGKFHIDQENRICIL